MFQSLVYRIVYRAVTLFRALFAQILEIRRIVRNSIFCKHRQLRHAKLELKRAFLRNLNGSRKLFLREHKPHFVIAFKVVLVSGKRVRIRVGRLYILPDTGQYTLNAAAAFLHVINVVCRQSLNARFLGKLPQFRAKRGFVTGIVVRKFKVQLFAENALVFVRRRNSLAFPAAFKQSGNLPARRATNSNKSLAVRRKAVFIGKRHFANACLLGNQTA